MHSPTPRGSIIIALLVLLGIAAGMGVTPRPEHASVATPQARVASPASGGFAAGFRPLLARAAAEAEALVEMGEARERNLLRIRAGQNAMHEALGAADGWLAEQPPAPGDVPAVEAYQEGATSIRTAMNEAQAGFLRLDFDRVARSTETMREGAALLDRAIDLLPD